MPKPKDNNPFLDPRHLKAFLEVKSKIIQTSTPYLSLNGMSSLPNCSKDQKK
jgi:hypothetical protein